MQKNCNSYRNETGKLQKHFDSLVRMQQTGVVCVPLGVFSVVSEVYRFCYAKRALGIEDRLLLKQLRKACAVARKYGKFSELFFQLVAAAATRPTKLENEECRSATLERLMTECVSGTYACMEWPSVYCLSFLLNETEGVFFARLKAKEEKRRTEAWDTWLASGLLFELELN